MELHEFETEADNSVIELDRWKVNVFEVYALSGGNLNVSSDVEPLIITVL